MKTRIVAALSLLIVAYSLGVATAHYEWKPYGLVIGSPTVARVLQWVREIGGTNHSQEAVRGAPNGSWKHAGIDGDILRTAFNRIFIAPDAQINPPVRGLADLKAQLESLRFDIGDPATLYDRVGIGVATASPDRVDVAYDLDGARSAHAYRIAASGREARQDCAVLAIPGTGENEAYEMATPGQTTYQKTIVTVAKTLCDVYVLIRPNQSIYAIHDGHNRLSDSYVFNYLLNRGGSYTAAYIADALALAKHLRGAYFRYAIAGLSQGGMAAMFLAILAAPDAAVVASGYSVLLDRVEPSAPNQFVIPGSFAVYNPDNVEEWLNTSKTRLLFTYGAKEHGVYGVESQDRPTCNRFARYPTVSCAIHDGGHVYPEIPIRQFLRATLHP